jgi:hypothetical protein
MALTLVEAAKRSQNPIQSAVIEMYARESDILRVLPFSDIQGNALRYNREETLPGVGFRGINEAYTESTGVINPIVEPLVIAGGDLDVDMFILNTMGMDQRSAQEAMKVKSLALAWTAQFVNGDSTTDPRGFDGMFVRVTGTQLIDNGAGGAAAALSLMNLDRLIDTVDNPTHLMMNKQMRRRLTVASRTAAVGGNILWSTDDFGRQVAAYNDLPILIADYDNNGTQIMQFNEPDIAVTGATVSTSIYCLSIGTNMVTGLQNGEMDVRDLGELQTQPAMRTRVEWYSGIACFHGRAIARLGSISDAAVVA